MSVTKMSVADSVTEMYPNFQKVAQKVNTAVFT